MQSFSRTASFATREKTGGVLIGHCEESREADAEAIQLDRAKCMCRGGVDYLRVGGHGARRAPLR